MYLVRFGCSVVCIWFGMVLASYAVMHIAYIEIITAFKSSSFPFVKFTGVCQKITQQLCHFCEIGNFALTCYINCKVPIYIYTQYYDLIQTMAPYENITK